MTPAILTALLGLAAVTLGLLWRLHREPERVTTAWLNHYLRTDGRRL